MEENRGLCSSRPGPLGLEPRQARLELSHLKIDADDCSQDISTHLDPHEARKSNR